MELLELVLRQHLSQDGLIVVVLTLDHETGTVVAGPDIISRGFIYMKESEVLIEEIKVLLKKQLQSFEEEGVRDWGTIKAGVKDIYMVISNVEPCQVLEFYKDNLALNQYLIERGKEDRLELAKTLPDDVTIHYTVQDPSGKYGTAVPIAMVVEEIRKACDKEVL